MAIGEHSTGTTPEQATNAGDPEPLEFENPENSEYDASTYHVETRASWAARKKLGGKAATVCGQEAQREQGQEMVYSYEQALKALEGSPLVDDARPCNACMEGVAVVAGLTVSALRRRCVWTTKGGFINCPEHGRYLLKCTR